MKNILYKALAVLALSATLTACSNDEETISGTGMVALEFDNSFNGNDLILETQTNTTASNEVLKITSIKYIISNIVLTKEDGTTYTYPKSESYFIVDEATAASHVIDLKNVPAANYTKVTFGVGVDKDQWSAGADGQGDFLATAQAAGMMWSWSAGYKFVAFEGTFTSATVTTAVPFKVHTGQTGTDYNYTTVSLDLQTKALVRTTITPQIHIITDLSKVLNSTNVIKLSDNNASGTGANIMGGSNLPLITQNVSTMFSVDHVHND
ncbi:MbnP family protein [uncultured Flavobacterium sp.]|uniref:MbnP family protein n=1 Tax=uncultured Flavobacterium sp. TaxID=165435 RepID=UPI0030EC4F8B|tara:strand:+ start:79043 stop:79840 length:798 start_codon:yes stop_codon:yes gene_type:complete